MRGAPAIVLAVALGLCSCSSASENEDIVELRDATKLKGVVRSATRSKVDVEAGGQRTSVPREKVKAIYSATRPQKSTREPSRSLVDALAAAKGIHSVVTAGVSYREYAPRVLDAKVKVDQALAAEDAAGEPDAKNAIAKAMLFYVAASSVWNASIYQRDGSLEAIGDNPVLELCPAVMERIGSDRYDRYMRGRAVTTQDLWSCAATALAEAERVLQR